MTADALFDTEPEVQRSALISADGLYRYSLGRWWAPKEPTATFVMLNPSTADADVDDPTIRRCIGFARSWGCGGIHVVNLYAYRATKPADLWIADDPVGPENDGMLETAAVIAAGVSGPLVAAWGANAKPERVHHVMGLEGMTAMQALGTTKYGDPRHPLYMRSDSRLTPYRDMSRPLTTRTTKRAAGGAG